jgi:hypothetical protein
MFPLLVGAVARDLDDCDTLVTPPTALAPLDLDTCDIDDGDDITGILTGLASTYGDVYVRAPSHDAWVYAAYTVFTVDDFYFLEDESAANTLLIQHVSVDPATCVGTDCTGFWVLWKFKNFDSVIIGGPKLSMTFLGNHPGLANCTTQDAPATQLGISEATREICGFNEALLSFRMDDGSAATLADVRANVRFSQMAAIDFFGSQTLGATTNVINQVNVAGMFLRPLELLRLAGSRIFGPTLIARYFPIRLCGSMAGTEQRPEERWLAVQSDVPTLTMIK